MLPVSLVPCTTKLEIDIKDRHGTNIQSMILEILHLVHKLPNLTLNTMQLRTPLYKKDTKKPQIAQWRLLEVKEMQKHQMACL